MGEGEPVVQAAKPEACAPPTPPASPAAVIAKSKAASRRNAKKPCDNHRATAQRRLDELFAAATASRFYGAVMVEVIFVNGEAKTVRHRLEGSDK